MAITTSYLVAVGKLGELLKAVRDAQPPERFTLKFLEDLGYKSTNDRLFIGLLKSLGFLDATGTPQQRYFDYLDDERSRRVLGEGIQAAYEDLFRLNKNAHQFTVETVKSKLKSLTQGQVSPAVINNMARTFLELVKHADFDGQPAPAPVASLASAVDKGSENGDSGSDGQTDSTNGTSEAPSPRRFSNEMPAGRSETVRPRLIDALAYRIEVVLPATRDKATYDAIFRSLKEHLL